MELWNLYAFILIAVFLVFGARAQKVVYCYYASWSYYRPGNGEFAVANIADAKGLCTHLAYAFFELNAQNFVVGDDPSLDIDLNNIKKVMNLKKDQPNLKVLMSVGGASEGSAKYSTMAATAQARKKFIDSAMRLIKKFDFDGLDLDWEYPVQKGGKPADYANYITLLKELHNRLSANNKLLAVAVAATKDSAAKSYNIPEMEKYVDFINIMTYDLGGSWDKKIGFNAPLTGPAAYTVSKSIEYWISKVSNRKKILLGIPLYGRSFSALTKKLGDPSYSGGARGPYTEESGLLGFNEICEKVTDSTQGWTTQWNEAAQVPFAFKKDGKGYQWVGYDNVKSVAKKVRYLGSKGLGGAMVWSIDTDDFRGKCGGGQYPLLNAINVNL